MKRNTQRLIAGLVIFMMIATVLVGIFGNGDSSAPQQPIPGLIVGV